jgi:hypothetical protein
MWQFCATYRSKLAILNKMSKISMGKK